MGWLLVAAVALVLVAGWCASAQAALLRVSRAGAKELGRSPGTGPAPLQAVLAEVTRYVAVLVLVQVIGEIVATVLVTAVLVHRISSDWRAFLIAAAVMIVVTYAITAVVPRSRGQQRTVRVATSAAAILHPVVRALGPFPRLLVATGTAFRRGSEGGEGPSGSEEELRGLVDLLEQRQIIQPDERAMIHSVFELGDTIVREVMVPRTDMVFVEQTKSLRQALSLALRSGFSRIPVVGENLDDVVGIAYLKDIVTRGYEHPEGESVETVDSVMRPATFVPESKPIDELLREMQARQTHVAIVIDEYGGTAGLVTIEDILEEIVGEIADEYDKEQPPVEWLDEGRARVTARLPVEELGELFGVSIEAEDVETVGGLLAQRLGRVPIPGATTVVAGLRLTAESLAGRRNRIGSVRIAQISLEAEVAGKQPAGRPGGRQSASDRAAGERASAERAGGERPGSGRAGGERPEAASPSSGNGDPAATGSGRVAGTGGGKAAGGGASGRRKAAGSGSGGAAGGSGQPASDQAPPGTTQTARPVTTPAQAPAGRGAGGSGAGGSGAGGSSDEAGERRGAGGSEAGGSSNEAGAAPGTGEVPEAADTPGAGEADAGDGPGEGQVSAGRRRPH
jgi:CBS domain containing-hemolysin-like protein